MPMAILAPIDKLLPFTCRVQIWNLRDRSGFDNYQKGIVVTLIDPALDFLVVFNLNLHLSIFADAKSNQFRL